MNSGTYYGEYLQLEKILDSQGLKSVENGTPAHDEMLFIITHQAYELWFKQIIFEVESIIDVFEDPVVEDKKMGQVVHRLERIKTIQRVFIPQLEIIETMTPLDFLEFRDMLLPASGFQSIQFKSIEILLGVKRRFRTAADQEFFQSRLIESDRKTLEELEKRPSLLDLTDRWLARMPFLMFKDFDFWKEYDLAVNNVLDSDQEIIDTNPTLTDREKKFQSDDLANTRVLFQSLLDEDKYNRLREKGEFRISRQAYLAALFIHLYRDEPMLYSPFRYLTLLMDIDELFANWRHRHATMVQRMLGSKIGTGGSSGFEYLRATTQKKRVFTDLFNLSSFMIPRADLPVLPDELRRSLGFFFGGKTS